MIFLLPDLPRLLAVAAVCSAVFCMLSLSYFLVTGDFTGTLIGGIPVAIPALMLPILCWQTRSVRAAVRLLRSGDTRAAIELARQEIQLRGPSLQRLTLLGTCLDVDEQFEEALAAFQQAERFCKGAILTSLVRANEGRALVKLGRVDEAEHLLADVCRESPKNFLARCYYCIALAELGRTADALEQYRHARKLSGRQRWFSATLATEMDDRLTECKSKLPA